MQFVRPNAIGAHVKEKQIVQHQHTFSTLAGEMITTEIESTHAPQSGNRLGNDQSSSILDCITRQVETVQIRHFLERGCEQENTVVSNKVA